MTDYYIDDDEYEDALEHEDDYDYYDGQDLGQDVDELRPTEVEGRTSWIYLGLLTGLFVLLVLFSWACNDRSDPPGEPTTDEAAQVAEGSTAVALTITVDGDVATVSGAVPDEAARAQVLSATQALYGAENVIDELQVDDGTTLDGGTISILGAAPFEDERPAELRGAIVAGLGLSEGEFSIDRGDVAVDPVAIEGQLDDGTIVLTGTVPDDASVVDLIAAAEAVWGPGSVDGSGLSVADSTWTDATVTVVGTAAAGDTRAASFPAEIEARFGNLVTVDVSGVELDASPEALKALQDELADALDQSPIQFAPLSVEISPESDEVIVVIADTLKTIPGVPVEVVGHTDSAGDPDENLVLSRDRAQSVVDRLIELGVDGASLNARGEGDAIPIADNTTEEGRALNRRIEVRLVGAAE